MITSLEDLPAVLITKEVAEVLRLGIDETRDLIKAGKLRATNIGLGRRPTYRVLKSDVIAYLNGDVEQGRTTSR